MSRRKGVRVKGEDGKPIRVLFTAHHCCIRVIKQLRSLKKLGYKIDILTNIVSYGTHEFNAVHYYHTEEQFKNTVREIGHLFDLVVHHNEPNVQTIWLDEIKKECGFKYKILTDFHDINSIRLGTADKEEIKVMQIADGLIYVSEPCQKLTNELYNYTRPSVIFEHYCNKEWVGYKNYVPGPVDLSRRHGIVYEGGLNPPEHMTDPAQRDMFKYRTIYPYFKEAVANGNEVILFVGNPNGYQTHLDIGATVFPPTAYDEMMMRMQEYKWGWVIFGEKDNPQTKYTQANKFYEYIKTGCIPIVCWCEETERVTKELGCGIVLNNPKELGNIEANFGHLYPKLKARVDEINITGELDSENHINKIEGLWRQVLQK